MNQDDLHIVQGQIDALAFVVAAVIGSLPTHMARSVRRVLAADADLRDEAASAAPGSAIGAAAAAALLRAVSNAGGQDLPASAPD